MLLRGLALVMGVVTVTKNHPLSRYTTRTPFRIDDRSFRSVHGYLTHKIVCDNTLDSCASAGLSRQGCRIWYFPCLPTRFPTVGAVKCRLPWLTRSCFSLTAR